MRCVGSCRVLVENSRTMSFCRSFNGISDSISEWARPSVLGASGRTCACQSHALSWQLTACARIHMRPVRASVFEEGRCALACDCVLCFVRRYHWAVCARSQLGEALFECCGPSMPRTQRLRAGGTARQEAERLRQHCGIHNTTCT